MPRSITDALRADLYGPVTGNVLLVFLKIEHPEIFEPIRLVSEDYMGVSHENGLPINYNLAGELYYGMPFGLDLLTDEDDTPTGKLRVANIDKRIGIAVQTISDSPLLTVSLAMLSDWNLTVGSNNARSPSGTPTILYKASYLTLKDVKGDEIALEGTITAWDFSSEMFPGIRSTPDFFPGLFK